MTAISAAIRRWCFRASTSRSSSSRSDRWQAYLIFILLLVAVSCQTPQNSGPVTVDVAANRGWQDAGVTVRSGETMAHACFRRRAAAGVSGAAERFLPIDLTTWVADGIHRDRVGF